MDVNELELYDGKQPEVRYETTAPKISIFRRIWTKLFKRKITYIETETPNGVFKVYYDNKIDRLVFHFPDDLKLRIVGGVDIQQTGDFNLETLGEINLLTHDNMLNLDSLNSKIFINSMMSKQIRDLDMSVELRDQIMTQWKEKEKSSRKDKCIVHEQMEIIGELVHRLNELESVVHGKPIDKDAILERIRKVNNHE